MVLRGGLYGPPYELRVGLVLGCMLEGTEVGSNPLLMTFQSVPHALVLLVPCGVFWNIALIRLTTRFVTFFLSEFELKS